MLAPKRYVIPAAVIIFAIIAAAFFITPHRYLTVRDRDTGELYSRYSMNEGEIFSVEFKHSVNLSPVIDVYEIQDGNIYVEETIYYHFGAGVQTELNVGEVLSYGDDGSMIISNIHQMRNNVGYIVGTVYDHILRINNKEINLRELCGRNTAIRFNYEFFIF